VLKTPIIKPTDVVYRQIKMPNSMVTKDLTLRNYSSFVYRSMIKSHVNKIVKKHLTSLTCDDDDNDINLDVPKFATIAEPVSGLLIKSAEFTIPTKNSNDYEDKNINNDCTYNSDADSFTENTNNEDYSDESEDEK